MVPLSLAVLYKNEINFKGHLSHTYVATPSGADSPSYPASIQEAGPEAGLDAMEGKVKVSRHT